jgi:hypothetical protein
MNSFCDNPIICFSFTVGNIISSLMCSLVHTDRSNASTHFVLQYLQVGPIMYCSHTIFEDATPELVRDFFWDFDFRRKWDHMLGYSKTLDEFPQNGTMIVHWIKKVLTNICCACVLSCLLHKSPTSFFCSSHSFAVTENTSLEAAYGNLGKLTIVLQRYI